MKYIIINKENEEEKVCDIFFNKKTEAEQYLNANFTELERENLTIVSGIERYIIVMKKGDTETFVKTLDDVIKGGFANCADYKRKSFSCLGIANIAMNRLATFALKNGIECQFHIQQFII